MIIPHVLTENKPDRQEDKRIDRLEEVDLSGLRIPAIVVYESPDDYQGLFVSRVFDLDQPTDVVMIKQTMNEITSEIRKNTDMVFMARGADDVPALAGVWI